MFFCARLVYYTASCALVAQKQPYYQVYRSTAVVRTTSHHEQQASGAPVARLVFVVFVVVVVVLVPGATTVFFPCCCWWWYLVLLYMYWYDIIPSFFSREECIRQATPSHPHLHTTCCHHSNTTKTGLSQYCASSK